MKYTRFISLLLALLLSLPLTACSNTDPAESDDPVTAETVPAETETETTTADIVTAAYQGQDMGGYSFRVLAPGAGGHWYTMISPTFNEVWEEETNGEPLNDGIYARNVQTEELLNIEITPVWENNSETLTNTIRSTVMGGLDNFDAILNRMDFMGTSMTAGHLLNLRNISTLNTENPWWDKNIVDAFTLFGSKLYFISGDLNIYDDFAAQVIYFNKNLCDDSRMEYPYAAVIEGAWTIDRFYDMAKTVEKDVDGDGVITVGTDIIGHAESNSPIKHWLYAMGEKTIDIDEEGNLYLRILEEKQINAVDKLYAMMVDRSMTYIEPMSFFPDGKTLFIGETMGCINSLRDMEDEFGVIPMPKMDESQENYREYVSNGWTTVYGVPIVGGDPERTGTILEVLSGYSTDTVRTALYDVLFAAKLVRDTDSVAMMDIIFSSKCYDWAVDFSWGGEFQTMYNEIYEKRTNNYVSSAEKKVKSMTSRLESLLKKIDNLEF